MLTAGVTIDPFASQVARDGQGEVPWWRTQLGQEEIDAVASAIRSEQISMGSVTEQFEQEVSQAFDVPYVVATTSGTSALLMAMMALEVGPGDEVIVPARTFIATAHAAAVVGAKIVLADCRDDRPVVDVAEIERKLSARTKVVVPVHLNGRACAMDEITALAQARGIAVVEDAAQAAFSRLGERYLGTLGDLGCFSLGMTKLIASGQGGIVVTRRKALYDKLRRIRANGVDSVINHRYVSKGLNFKVSDLLAAIALCQLRRAQASADHCAEIQASYARGLARLPFIDLLPFDAAAGERGPWAEAVSPQRDALIDFLAQRGIQTRRFVPSLNSAEHLACGDSYPNAERFGATGLILPCGPAQALANVERVVAALEGFCG